MAQINNCDDAFEQLKSNFNPYCEEFRLLTLNTQLELIRITLIAKGTLNFCLVHPRDVFREALMDNAFTLIIAHNHPSLNVQPTLEDLKLTKKLVKLSHLIEIPIVDHLIYTEVQYFSFKKNNLI
ncbi:MAG: JAB domain-containing protein [Pseudobdellovibrio sp.]